MPAPVRITLRGTGLNISAFLIADLMPVEASLVCKTCAPVKTRMRLLAEIAIYQPDKTSQYKIWECLTCRRQWAQSIEVAEEVKAKV